MQRSGSARHASSAATQVKDFNLRQFLTLKQADGYNPLTVQTAYPRPRRNLPDESFRPSPASAEYPRRDRSVAATRLRGITRKPRRYFSMETPGEFDWQAPV